MIDSETVLLSTNPESINALTETFDLPVRKITKVTNGEELLLDPHKEVKTESRYCVFMPEVEEFFSNRQKDVEISYKVYDRLVECIEHCSFWGRLKYLFSNDRKHLTAPTEDVYLPQVKQNERE